jgi:predicted nucleotidyltransferase
MDRTASRVDTGTLTLLPETVRAELARRQVPLADVAALLDVRDGDAVLLTGSYATGEFKPTSDLDFLVLTPSRASRRLPGTTNHPSIFGDSFDGRVGDLVVNVEYIAVDLLAVLCTALDQARSTPDSPDLPNLQGLELRLVHRLATGVPLVGAARIAELRRQADVETARAAAAGLFFVMALSFLEDTQVLEPPAREVLGRGAGEALLLAAVNAYGRITYDAKHLCSRAATLARLPGLPGIFAARERVLFADRLPTAEATALLLDLAVELYRSFAAPACPPLLLPMLAPFRPTWTWTGREW